MLGLEDLDSYREAIAGIESAGSGDYNAVGKPTRDGDRAYGRYQVMGKNIPAWTHKVLGQAMTPEEFMANPQAQDAVFDDQFGGAVMRYGNPQDAASEWFTGKPLAQGAKRSDGRLNGAQYVQKFNTHLARAQTDRAIMSDDRDEVLQKYNTEPKDGDAPDRDAILKKYSTPSAPSPKGDVKGRAADLFGGKVAGEGAPSGADDENLKAAGLKAHPELQPSNPLFSLKYDPHHSGLAALITPGSADEKMARLSEWAQQWAADNPDLVKAATSVGGLAALRYSPALAKLLLKHAGHIGVGAVAGDYLMSKHGIGKDLMELLGMGAR